MWLVLAFLSAGFAGITAILAKIGLRNVNSNLATALRTIVVLLFSWLMVFIVGSASEIKDISVKTFIFLILSGLSTGASWLCYFKALRLGDVNKVTPIDKSSTVLTMILALIFLGEKLTAVKIIGMVLIGTGTFLMIEKKKTDNSSADKRSGASLVYAMFSAVFAALTSIFGKIGIEDVESNLGTAIRTVVVLLMAWILVFAEKKQSEIKDIDKKKLAVFDPFGVHHRRLMALLLRSPEKRPRKHHCTDRQIEHRCNRSLFIYNIKRKAFKKSFSGTCADSGGYSVASY